MTQSFCSHILRISLSTQTSNIWRQKNSLLQIIVREKLGFWLSKEFHLNPKFEKVRWPNKGELYKRLAELILWGCTEHNMKQCGINVNARERATRWMDESNLQQHDWRKHCAPKGKKQRFWRQRKALLAESKIIICQMTYKSVRTEGAAGHGVFYHSHAYGAWIIATWTIIWRTNT